jgi:hypothetical protein
MLLDDFNSLVSQIYSGSYDAASVRCSKAYFEPPASLG